MGGDLYVWPCGCRVSLLNWFVEGNSKGILGLGCCWYGCKLKVEEDSVFCFVGRGTLRVVDIDEDHRELSRKGCCSLLTPLRRCGGRRGGLEGRMKRGGLYFLLDWFTFVFGLGAF